MHWILSWSNIVFDQSNPEIIVEADDCGNNSDENNCKATVAPTSTTVASKTESPKAKLGQIREGINCDTFSFYCPNDNRYILDKWVCDGFIDCKDSYDE